MDSNQGQDMERLEQVAEPSDGSLIVDMTLDRMEAYIQVVPPVNGGKPITREIIDKALEQAGVVFGVIEQVKDYAVRLDKPGTFTIAKGQLPVDGEDAVIDFKCDFSHLIGKPKELVNGRADFYNLNLVHNINPGDVLAVRTPATPGTLGYNVLGQPLPAKPGKDFKLVAGPNTAFLEDQVTLVATAGGHAVIAGNRITVSKVFEVSGDVDFKTGNVEFRGSVVVRGSVREGFRVVAENDVEITGTISDGTVACGGNLTVKNGIVGKKSVIKAGGNVVTKFIENASVDCGQNLIVGDAILHSRVFAGKSVTVGGKGAIAGGLIRASEEIDCKNLGSPMATATEVEVGLNPELRQRYAVISKEKKKKEEEFDQAAKGVKLLNMLKEQLGGDLPEDKQGILDRVSKAEAELAASLEEMKWVLRDIEEQMRLADTGRVKVAGTLYPGVKVSIGIAIKHFYDKVNYATLIKSGADIKVMSYK